MQEKTSQTNSPVYSGERTCVHLVKRPMFFYPPEVRSMKYCGLEVFWKKYIMLGTSRNKTARKMALKSLKNAINF